MISEELKKKIERSIRILRSIDDTEPIEIAYSGGKDSAVILQLAKEAGINYRAIYKCTTIDPPGTIAHVKEMGVEVLKPKRYTFAQLIQRKGLPSRIRRFCCKDLKEYKVLDKSVIGVRKAESNARNKRYQEPTQCRFYGGRKKEHVEAIYPILDWTTQDIVDFVTDRSIKLHPLYYKADGTIDGTQRLGCMCCQLASKKKRIEEFKKHPGIVKFYIRNLQIYFDTHPNSKCVKNHADAYEQFVHDVFYPGSRDWETFKTGLFAEEFDYKGFLEKTFNIEFNTKPK